MKTFRRRCERTGNCFQRGFFDTGIDQDYNWDSFSVRGGWIIPFETSD